MQSTKLSAGDPIQARCTKCRKNSDHIVVIMAEDGPDKVKCSACDREHKYRPPTSPKKTAAKKRAINNKEAERKEWESLRPIMNRKEAKAYSMTGAYKVKGVIDHPVFGLGFVQRVAGPRKIEVLFEDGRKTMRCQ
jgi:hypothetical protein